MDTILVQANVAKAKYDFSDERMQSFFCQVEALKDLAHAWPGFVAEPELIDRGSIFFPPFLINVSFWESIEALKEYTYSGMHLAAIKSKGDWFEKHDYPSLILFWAERSYKPSEKEIQKKLLYLKEHGPTQDVFTFAHRFSMPTRTVDAKLNLTSRVLASASL